MNVNEALDWIIRAGLADGLSQAEVIMALARAVGRVPELAERVDRIAPCKPLEISALAVAVGRRLAVSVAEMKGESSNRSIVEARMILIHLCCQLTSLSYSAIARWFGYADHTSALHLAQRAKTAIDGSERLRTIVDGVTGEFLPAQPSRPPATPMLLPLAPEVVSAHTGEEPATAPTASPPDLPVPEPAPPPDRTTSPPPPLPDAAKIRPVVSGAGLMGWGARILPRGAELRSRKAGPPARALRSPSLSPPAAPRRSGTSSAPSVRLGGWAGPPLL